MPKTPGRFFSASGCFGHSGRERREERRRTRRARTAGPSAEREGDRCDARNPRDPQGTLDRIEGGVLHAGISPNGDFVRIDGDRPNGSELNALTDFAASMDAEVDWTVGSEEALVRGLENGDLDVETAREGCVSLARKIQDVVVVPVPELPEVVAAVTPRGSTA